MERPRPAPDQDAAGGSEPDAKRREAALVYAKGVNDGFYDQLKVADQKATYIMTIIVFLLVWSPDVRRLFFWRDVGPTFDVKWFVSAGLTVALVTALLSALSVVIPRRRKGGALLFWGAWPEARDAAIALVDACDERALARTYIDNAGNLAAICRSKYRFVSIAFVALLAALALHAILMALP